MKTETVEWRENKKYNYNVWTKAERNGTLDKQQTENGWNNLGWERISLVQVLSATEYCLLCESEGLTQLITLANDDLDALNIFYEIEKREDYIDYIA
jgi:hypothetical protein